MIQQPDDAGRRQFLKNAGAAAGATLWVAPSMQTVRMATTQTTGSVVDPGLPNTTTPCDRTVSIDVNRRSTSSVQANVEGVLPGAGRNGIDVIWGVSILGEGTIGDPRADWTATAFAQSIAPGTELCGYVVAVEASYIVTGSTPVPFTLGPGFQTSGRGPNRIFLIDQALAPEITLVVHHVAIDLCQFRCGRP